MLIRQYNSFDLFINSAAVVAVANVVAQEVKANVFNSVWSSTKSLAYKVVEEYHVLSFVAAAIMIKNTPTFYKQVIGGAATGLFVSNSLYNYKKEIKGGVDTIWNFAKDNFIISATVTGGGVAGIGAAVGYDKIWRVTKLVIHTVKDSHICSATIGGALVAGGAAVIYSYRKEIKIEFDLGYDVIKNVTSSGWDSTKYLASSGWDITKESTFSGCAFTHYVVSSSWNNTEYLFSSTFGFIKEHSTFFTGAALLVMGALVCYKVGALSSLYNMLARIDEEAIVGRGEEDLLPAYEVGGAPPPAYEVGGAPPPAYAEVNLAG
jgi:hypothetical protein